MTALLCSDGNWQQFLAVVTVGRDDVRLRKVSVVMVVMCRIGPTEGSWRP